MDGVPAPAGTFTEVAPTAVVSVMVAGGGGLLIASSTIPSGLATAFTVATAGAGAGWLL
jgi:hypothetical protein